MPKDKKTLIMKFGGGVLDGSHGFHRIADLIMKKQQEYEQIAVVVSAMQGVTNHLIALAKSVNPTPPSREYDMLVSVGERVSISLLAMALFAKQIKAVSFTGSQSGVITTTEHGEAKIINVRPHRLLPHLEEGKVVIVAGFQGMSEAKEITTLGRGGSDTTAVALAIALDAEKVLFYKDVGGIFPVDPKKESGTQMYTCLTYDEVAAIVKRTGGVLHLRAIELAKKNGVPLEIAPFWEDNQEGTMIISDTICREKVYEISPYYNTL